MKQLNVLDCKTPLAGASLSDDEAAELESLFRLLGDRHRLKILHVLLRAKGEPVCVCEFTPTLGIGQPTVSYHLKLLADAGLLERERKGSFVYYRLQAEALERLSGLIAPPTGLREAV